MSYFFSCLQDDKKSHCDFLKNYFCTVMSHFSFKVSGSTKVTAVVLLKGTGNIKIVLLNCLELFSDRSISTLKLSPLLMF